MSDNGSQRELIDEGRRLAMELCMSQIGNVEMMAGGTAQALSSQLAANPDLAYIVVRHLATALVNTADQFIGCFKLYQPFASEGDLFTAASDDMIDRTREIEIYLRDLVFTGFDMRPGPPPPPD
jgi:hypothetical protein